MRNWQIRLRTVYEDVYDDVIAVYEEIKHIETTLHSDIARSM